MAKDSLRIDKTKTPLRADLSAGLVVFLVALPLCLGIANASGSSPLSGIFAGVIGGVVIGLISGSPLSVSGPAAGLVAIIVGALATLGGSFQALQCAIILAGLIQVVLGVLKLGNIANFIPNSVIKGMLAGIGAVIILKQVPHALGWDRDYEAELGFISRFGNTFTDIYKAVATLTPAAVLIFGIALATILFWDSKRMKSTRVAKLVPGALVAVILGALINEGLKLGVSGFALKAGDGHLVVLPLGDQLLKSFTLPNWKMMANGSVWVIGFTIAIVASIESLLCVEASDKLDEKRRVTPTNRELVAQGIGNTFCGLFGGLPVTSVVVRSTANAYAGAQTKMAAVFHGVFLGISALLLAAWMNSIPLACLAAVLIVVGFKLTKPAIFREMWGQGLDQFIPFLVTYLGVIFSDLLKGVLVGVVAAVYFVIRSNQHRAFTLVNDGSLYMLRFNKDSSFTTKASLRKTLDSIPDGATVYVNGRDANVIDHDIIDMIRDFTENGKYRGVTVELSEVEGKTWSLRAKQARAAFVKKGVYGES